MSVELITAIVTLCSAGGVVYLLVDKTFGRKKDKAETATINQQNNMSAVETYKAIDETVSVKLDKLEKKTLEREQHYEERLEKMNKRVQRLETLKCFNLECKQRVQMSSTAPFLLAEEDSNNSEDDSIPVI